MANELNRSAHSSALKFNYLLRPRKGAERKMLCESFQRLCYFHPLEKYEYIGFGAFYFADFKIFHRHLGIRRMISIEHDPSIQKRVSFNKPYSFVDIKRGSSNDVLKNHTWRSPSIMWLDYDSVLDVSHLRDLEYFVQNAKSGSVILITSDADPKALDKRVPDAIRGKINNLFELVMPELSRDAEKERRVKRLFEQCGIGDVRLNSLRERLKGNLPQGIKEEDLDEEGLAGVLANLIKDEIKRNLGLRNATCPEKLAMKFQQLYYFTYADGRKMLTYGGILIDPKHEEALERSGIQDLDFVMLGRTSYEIDLPELTVKEMKFLEKYVPQQVSECPKKFEIRETEFTQYCTAYRYYPLYAEFEI